MVGAVDVAGVVVEDAEGGVWEKTVQLSALKFIPCTVKCFSIFEVLPDLQAIVLSHILHRALFESVLQKYNHAFDLGIFVAFWRLRS